MESPKQVEPATDCGDPSHTCGHEAEASSLASADSASTHDALPERRLVRERNRPERPWEQPLPDSGKGDGAPLDPRTEVERVPRRWDRLVRLVGDAGLRKLMGSRVTVFGLGGVGSYATEALARSAVGHLRLVDFDDVCVTNVNRQLQAFPGTVGQSKTALLAERVRAINPDVQLESIQAFYDPTNADALLDPKPDFVLDAIDNVTAKLHLLQTCLERDIPVVSVTGAGARLDPTQVRVDDLSRTRLDPLAKVIRKELSRRGIDTTSEVGLPVVFSEEAVRAPEVPTWDEEAGFQCICPHREDSPHACEKRRVIYGTASFVTAAFGMAAASVVIRKLSEVET